MSKRHVIGKTSGSVRKKFNSSFSSCVITKITRPKQPYGLYPSGQSLFIVHYRKRKK